MSFTRRAFTMGGLGLSLFGCGSPGPEPPAPTVRDPGTFVAVDEGKGWLTLYRCIDTFAFEEETLLFLRTYDVRPATVEEARALAQHGKLPILTPTSAIAIDQFPTGPAWIVWFRTLTEQEIALSQ